MMKRHYTLYIAAALLAVSLFACKKKEEETLPTLNGQITLMLPAYVTADETYDVKLGGQYLKSTVHRNEEGGIGYYFYNSVLYDRDTVRYESQPLTDPVEYHLAFKDTIGTFTLTCGAFAQKYYTVTNVASLTLVDPRPGRSLTGFEYHDGDLAFTDARDGRNYLATRIGGKWWMRQNLGWEGAGRAYLSSLREYANGGTSAISTILGRYYSWEEAKNACPEGWTLPGAQDWVDMISAVANVVIPDEGVDIDGVAGGLMAKAVKFNGKQFWQYWRDVNITDASALSVLPTGYAINTVPGIYSFHGYGSYAMFWTGSEENGRGVYRYINEKHPVLYRGLADKSSFCAPVRCIKNAE